jgi:uncharacterized protein (DUF952 family)
MSVVGPSLPDLDPRRVYKLLCAADCERLRAAGAWAGSPDDLRDGYVHLSAADQVAGTLAKYFADVPDLILLAVDPAMLGADLRYEPSRGGALFPHLYAPLPLAACQALAWRAQPALPWQAVHPRRDWQTDP